MKNVLRTLIILIPLVGAFTVPAMAGEILLKFKGGIGVNPVSRATGTPTNGTFSDVHKGQILQTVEVRLTIPQAPTIVITQTSNQTFYVKDGVGIVKQEREDRFEQTGDQPQITNLRAELQSYTLVP